MDADINTINFESDEARFLAGLADRFVEAERQALVACRLETKWLRRFAGERPATAVDVAEGTATVEGQMVPFDIVSASGRGVVDPATGVAPRYEWVWDVSTASGVETFNGLGIPRDGSVVVVGYPGKARVYASKKWGGEREVVRLGAPRVAKILSPGKGALAVDDLVVVRK